MMGSYWFCIMTHAENSTGFRRTTCFVEVLLLEIGSTPSACSHCGIPGAGVAYSQGCQECRKTRCVSDRVTRQVAGVGQRHQVTPPLATHSLQVRVTVATINVSGATRRLSISSNRGRSGCPIDQHEHRTLGTELRAPNAARRWNELGHTLIRAGIDAD